MSQFITSFLSLDIATFYLPVMVFTAILAIAGTTMMKKTIIDNCHFTKVNNMKVLAFGASNSKHSINKTLACYAAQQVNEADVTLLDLNKFEMPIYSVDREKELGIPQLAHDFYRAIGDSNCVIISFAEYNGSYSSAYKNVFDWVSRIDMKVFQNKPVIMLSTSPGQSGARSVLAAAQVSAPYFAANVISAISLPSFYDHFDLENNVITDKIFNQHLLTAISKVSRL